MLVAALLMQTPAPQSPVPGAPAGVMAFVDVTVVPMDTEGILQRHTVLVENGWITSMGPTNTVQVPAGATRIDGRAHYLMPGLAEMHAHLRQPKQAEEWLLQYLAQGVTTVRNMHWTKTPGILEQSLQVRARVASGELLGPRMYTGVRYVGNNTPEDINEKVAAYKAAGYDFIKVRGHIVKDNVESPAVLTVLAAAGHRVGLPVVGHYPLNYGGGDWKEALPFEQVLALGMRSFEHTGITQALKDPATRMARIAAIRRAGIWVCPTLAVIIGNELMVKVKEFVKLLHQDSGVGLLLGTDGGSVAEELRLLVVEVGLTPYQALMTGTRNVAAYAGTLSTTGTIAVGKRADFVLLSSNPLANIEAVQQPTGTMIGGRWLPREVLERRLVAFTPALNYAKEAYVSLLRPPSALADSTGTVFQSSSGMKVPAELKLLADSLGASAETEAGRRRLLDLVVRHLAAYRATLPPAQQGEFDRRAREWMAQRAREGYAVTITGVAK